MNFRILVILAIAFGNMLNTAMSQTFSADRLKGHIMFLASDSLKGRYPGTPEDMVAAQYIRDQFASYGLELLYNEGLQPFEVITSVRPSIEHTQMSVGRSAAAFGDDFGLYAFSSSASVTADVVFAGFGFVLNTDELTHNDYENIDATDKWVVVLKGDPEPDNNTSPFIPFADERNKAMFARDQGAAGVIFIGGGSNMPEDDPAPFRVERSVSDVGLPVIDLRKSWADAHLFQHEWLTDSIEAMMMRGDKASKINIQARISATAELLYEKVETYNIVGKLTSSNTLLKDEYILFGAHYDHLGMGGPGSGSRHPDTIAPHYGADDNASGVAGVIEMAHFFSSRSGEIDRSLLFVAFGAEEMGLLGSKHFANNPPVPIEQIVTMVNFDMIGRLSDNKSVSVSGTGTAIEMESLLTEQAENNLLSLSFSPEGYGASDHASFYAKDVPVMFFTTGAHPDYHTPNDTYERINFDGMVEVLEFVSSVSNQLAKRPDRLTFQEAGPKERQQSSRGFRVTLGIMPDFTSSGGGLPVGGVTKDGPAESAGMLRGDVIVAINGLSVENIYDYMNRLNQLKRGERANVDVLRDGKRLVLIVDL